jgi:uncharacterized membrane protein YgaE (UPF0421/DUF939 family)
MNERLKSLAIYAAKCVAGTLIVIGISSLLHYKDFIWALISVILVLSPDGKDTLDLAFIRIKANAIGASAGLLCLLICPANMWTISLALSVTLYVCYFFKLDAAARSALAATIIIMLHEEGKHIWDTALERVIAVLAGCVLGLLITVVFHFRAKPKQKAVSGDNHGEA